jgi:hypothetical protein
MLQVFSSGRNLRSALQHVDWSFYGEKSIRRAHKWSITSHTVLAKSLIYRQARNAGYAIFIRSRAASARR